MMIFPKQHKGGIKEDAPFRMRVKVASDFKWDNLDDDSDYECFKIPSL